MPRHHEQTGASLHPQIRWVQASDPIADARNGDLWLDTDTNIVYVLDSSAWLEVKISAATLAGLLHAATGKSTPVDADELALADSAASYALKKLTWANLKATAKTYFDTLYSALGHTHVAANVTDFDTQVRTSRLDQMAAPTANVSMNSHKITSVTDPTSAQDAATKAYVDSAAAGAPGSVTSVNGNTGAVTVESIIHAATSKTTPVNADELALVDTEAANVIKKLTLTNAKAFLKTYFDGLYAALSHTHVEGDLSTSDITTANVTSTKHGFAPKSPADATQFLNGAATPAFAAVKDSDLSTSDVTTNNVSTTKHGFTPKAPNDAAKFLDGTGAWTVPPGTFTNPMTTQDDIIVGGASGALGRLGKGSDGQVLTVDPTTHHLVWATPSSGGASNLDGLSDVVITSAVLGNVLQHDGSNFVNAPPPIALLTAPPTASWSWVNQGSATLTSDSYGELITMPAGSGSNNWRHRVRTIVHSAAYAITAKIDVEWTRTTSGTLHAALVIRDNAGGVNKFCAWGIHYDGNPEVTYLYQGDWTNNTTESVANFKQPLAKFPFNPRWFRIRIASGTRFYEASENGIDFYTILTASSTGFITPDQAGFAANDAAATPPLVRLRSLAVA